MWLTGADVHRGTRGEYNPDFRGASEPGCGRRVRRGKMQSYLKTESQKRDDANHD